MVILVLPGNILSLLHYAAADGAKIL